MITAFSLPTLSIGWLHDDAFHSEMFHGSHPSMSRPIDEAYCFGGGPHHRSGIQWPPWWKLPGMEVCYFRPLSSLILAFEHLCMDRHPALTHALSFGWLLLACAAIYRLAGRLFDRSTAIIACVLYGTANFSTTPIAWAAASHAVVTAALTACGLACYVFGREERRSLHGVLGLVGMTLALLAGEAAIGGFGFVVAYELLRARDARRTRLAFGVAAAGIALAFVAWYTHAGYGAHGSGGYLDPAGRPREFLREVPLRLLALLGDATLGLPSDGWQLPQARPFLAAGGAVSLLLLLAIFSRYPSDRERMTAVRFLSLGALLAAIPGTAAVLGGRVLMVPGLGLSAVLAAALLLPANGSAAPPGGRPRWVRAAAGVVGFGLLALNPLLRLGMLGTLYKSYAAERQVASSSLAGCAQAQHFYVVGTHELTVAVYAPYLLKEQLGQRDWQQLTLAADDIEIDRSGPRTLLLRGASGKLIHGMGYTLMRPESSPLLPGTQIPLGELTIRVKSSTPLQIESMELELARQADDPSYCWLRYDGAELVPFLLPAPGGHMTLPYVRGPMSL